MMARLLMGSKIWNKWFWVLSSGFMLVSCFYDGTCCSAACPVLALQFRGSTRPQISTAEVTCWRAPTAFPSKQCIKLRILHFLPALTSVLSWLFVESISVFSNDRKRQNCFKCMVSLFTPFGSFAQNKTFLTMRMINSLAFQSFSFSSVI